MASNKPGAKALERAAGAGVETRRLRARRARRPREQRRRDRRLARAAVGVDLVVLAGYMELLSRRVRPAIPRADRQRPPGAAARRSRAWTPIGQALEHGVRVTGVTVHFVDEGVDSGPIILQRAIEVPYTRDRSELEEQIHRVEHELLPEAIRMIAAGAVSVDAGQSATRSRR